eukprot:gnl/MRDRNA2_/MRDRNA2_112058_c0_seq1.p1 gnl/MRDRNA2_/MRDRNA2_112058_c0~~gnl/MRDRNA2_/MRDRNA2_112058_c0_seq1.p1  ORF type:complete len:496 (-),score=79.00 gnl/MRDRNA2_/MRDRNA2_112058_c0_seq1:99-1586(-)
MSSIVTPFSSFDLDVAGIFPPQVIGSALGKLWVVEGQQMVWRSSGLECPITLSPLKQPALLYDGSIYEAAAIARWLQQRNTSPCTNLALKHMKFLKLEPLKKIIEHFLAETGVLKNNAGQALEHAIRDAKVSNNEPSLRVKQLETHIESATMEIVRLQALIADAEELKAQIVTEIDQSAVASDGCDPQQHQSIPEDPLAKQFATLKKVAYNDLRFAEQLHGGERDQVYRGVYNGREVAIKHLECDSTQWPEAVVQDLVKEARFFQDLPHRRVTPFIGACLDGPHPCIVTEYLAGGSLYELLHIRKLRLPLLHCMNMCLQVSDVVTYLHSQNPCVVHLDLNSLNLVLDMNLNLRICDFGMAESMDGTSIHIANTKRRSSRQNCAPELLLDQKDKITEKVDVWDMGRIFVEIFGGPCPGFGVEAMTDLTRGIFQNKSLNTLSVPNHIPLPCQEIIRSCWNSDPALRPTSKQIFERLKKAKKQLKQEGLLQIPGSGGS